MEYGQPRTDVSQKHSQEARYWRCSRSPPRPGTKQLAASSRLHVISLSASSTAAGGSRLDPVFRAITHLTDPAVEIAVAGRARAWRCARTRWPWRPRGIDSDDQSRLGQIGEAGRGATPSAAASRARIARAATRPWRSLCPSARLGWPGSSSPDGDLLSPNLERPSRGSASTARPCCRRPCATDPQRRRSCSPPLPVR